MKLIIQTNMPFGDCVCLSGAVRDLKLSFPEIEIKVESHYPEVFNGEHLSKLPFDTKTPGIRIIQTNYSSLRHDIHLVQTFRDILSYKLKLTIKPTENKGSFTIIPEEKTVIYSSFWAICPSQSEDLSCKNYPHYEKIITLCPKISFVLLAKHPITLHLPNLQNLTGKTTISSLLQILYRVQGFLGPVTGPLHALKVLNPDSKAIVLIGGREEAAVTAYPNTTHISRIGKYDCCSSSACWKRSVVGHPKSSCLRPVRVLNGTFPICMDEISPEVIADEIKNHTPSPTYQLS